MTLTFKLHSNDTKKITILDHSIYEYIKAPKKIKKIALSNLKKTIQHLDSKEKKLLTIDDIILVEARFESYVFKIDPNSNIYCQYDLDILLNNPRLIKLTNNNDNLCETIVYALGKCKHVDLLKIDEYLDDLLIINVDEKYEYGKVVHCDDNSRFLDLFLIDHYKENVSEDVRFLDLYKYGSFLNTIGYVSDCGYVLKYNGEEK